MQVILGVFTALHSVHLIEKEAGLSPVDSTRCQWAAEKVFRSGTMEVCLFHSDSKPMSWKNLLTWITESRSPGCVRNLTISVASSGELRGRGLERCQVSQQLLSM